MMAFGSLFPLLPLFSGLLSPLQLVDDFLIDIQPKCSPLARPPARSPSQVMAS